MNIKIKRRIWLWLSTYKIWRTSAYNRGHQDGYKRATTIDKQEREYWSRMASYYYAHVNDCQTKGCKKCKSL